MLPILHALLMLFMLHTLLRLHALPMLPVLPILLTLFCGIFRCNYNFYRSAYLLYNHHVRF